MNRYALYLRREELNDIAMGGGVAVVPTGSLEQHGRHLPVGTDSLLVEAVSREAVEQVSDRGVEAVVFPALWTGFSPHHVPFGGTVTLRKETLLALLEDVCRSLIGMGFEKILLVNGHGGNRPAVALVAGDLGTSQREADVGELSYLSLAAKIADEVRDGKPGSAYHAGEVETALLLYLRSELVAMDEARDDPVQPLTSFSPSDMFDGGPLGTRRTYDRLSADGVRGEPTLARADVGEALFDELTDRLTSLIEEFAALNGNGAGEGDDNPTTADGSNRV